MTLGLGVYGAAFNLVKRKMWWFSANVVQRPRLYRLVEACSEQNPQKMRTGETCLNGVF